MENSENELLKVAMAKKEENTDAGRTESHTAEPEHEEIVCSSSSPLQWNADDSDIMINFNAQSSAEIESTGSDITDSDLTNVTSASTNGYITDEELRTYCAHLPEEEFNNSAIRIRNELAAYERALIIAQGLTPEEARTAAINNFKKQMKDADDKYLEVNPEAAIVRIDKTQEEHVMAQFTQEEKDKLAKVRTLQLHIVEDVDLPLIEEEKVDKEHRAELLQGIDNSLAKYSVPLLFTRDYASFKGAQIIQMINALKNEDDSLYDELSKKAYLIYDRFYNGTAIKKHDANGKVILGVEEFLDKFMYQDVDIALYAILCASSMEDVENEFTCNLCSKQFPWKYKLRSILNMKGLDDEKYETLKKRLDDILGAKANKAAMDEIRTYKNVRLGSKFSNNQFVIEEPSIAKALNIFALINEKDPAIVQNAILALYIQTLYIYNPSSGKYVKIDCTDYKDMLEAISLLSDVDIELLTVYLQDKLYKPEFTLTMKCPHCAKEVSLTVPIDQYVFMKAQSSTVEITM